MKCSRCGSKNIRLSQPSLIGSVFGGLLGLTLIGRPLAHGVTDRYYKCMGCGHRVANVR